MPAALSDRLTKAASMVAPCDTVADIGADHALLSIFLLEQGRCRTGLCTDKSRAPLKKARTALTARGLAERCEFLLGDGLLVLEGCSVDTVVIAGLGGDTIRDILSVDPAHLQNRSFVLQPMSKHTSLRLCLSRIGFCVQEEVLAEDGGRIYPILRVFYDGIPRKSAPLELLCGRQNLLRRDATTLRYLRGLSLSLTRRVEGRRAAGLDTAAEQKLLSALNDHLNTQEAP